MSPADLPGSHTGDRYTIRSGVASNSPSPAAQEEAKSIESPMKSRLTISQLILRYILPWLITCIALYYAFRSVDWDTLVSHIVGVDPAILLLAAVFTGLSYLLRARRWQIFFPKPVLSFAEAARVLVLGFFMNNILPARAGELVRAHVGSRVSGETRTLVLATVASERLVDGLTLSLYFLLFAVGLAGPEVSGGLLYVAALFGGVALAVGAALFFRAWILTVLEKLKGRFTHDAAGYVLDRIAVFLNGLAPLYTKSKLPRIALWSIVIWSVELCVYVVIASAFGMQLSTSVAVLFMVAVNFSSLIPAAPGGIGVIEAVASSVLVSQGIDREVALAMVICQHVIQYLVVGIPGVAILFTWRKMVQAATEDNEGPSPT